MSEFYLYQKSLNQRLRNQDNPAHSCQQCPNCPESPWYQANEKGKKHMLGTHVLTYALRVEQESGVYSGVLRDQCRKPPKLHTSFCHALLSRDDSRPTAKRIRIPEFLIWNFRCQHLLWN